MLTRRNVLKRFASTVAAGGMALLGLRPAKASPAFRPVKSFEWVEGEVFHIGYFFPSGSPVRYFEFGSYKACVHFKYIVVILRDGRRMIRPAKDVQHGDTIFLSKYLTEQWCRRSILKSWNRKRIKEQKC